MGTERDEQRYFNPRSPWGERRHGIGQSHRSYSYFNPRSPWGERLAVRPVSVHSVGISIHAPRGGSDQKKVDAILEEERFQSTLPVGGATRQLFDGHKKQNISIHAPRGGSDMLGQV